MTVSSNEGVKVSQEPSQTAAVGLATARACLVIRKEVFFPSYCFLELSRTHYLTLYFKIMF